jgi:hypothetical protein
MLYNHYGWITWKTAARGCQSIKRHAILPSCDEDSAFYDLAEALLLPFCYLRII